MKKFLSAFLLMSLAVVVHSQGVSAPSSFDRFMWSVTGGSSQTVGFGAGGQPIVTGSPPMIDTDGGLPRVSTSGTLTNPSGKPVPIAASGRISSLQTAKAVGRVALGFTGYLGVGVALYDLFKELGFDAIRAPDGALAVTKIDPNVCTVDCYTWKTMLHFGPFLGYYPDYSSACSALQAAYGSGSTCSLVDNPVGQVGHRSITICSGSNCYANLGIEWAPTISGVPSFTSSSVQEFIDTVATKSGWPATSNISKVLAEPSAGATEKIQPEPLTVTGPATSPGPVKLTTKTLPDGTVETTTETTTFKHDYLGPDITTTASTTTIVQTCTGAGSCAQTSTSTTTQPTDPVPDGTATDTAFSDLPQLYKPKYADGLEGVWAAKSAALKASPLLSLVNQLMPNIGVGGACPSWMLNLDIGPWAYGSHDVAPPCYIWDFAKVFVIIGALLLARALVFGG